MNLWDVRGVRRVGAFSECQQRAGQSTAQQNVSTEEGVSGTSDSHLGCLVQASYSCKIPALDRGVFVVVVWQPVRSRRMPNLNTVREAQNTLGNSTQHAKGWQA